MSLTLSVLIMANAVSATANEPIGVYDLTYAATFDAKDPNTVMRAWDHCHAVATLQGIVNRDAPRLYVRSVQAYGRNVDDFWLEKMSEPGQWLHGRKRETIPDIRALIQRYRKFIKGVVLYDPRVPATSNLASTLAGACDLIALRYDLAPDSLYHQLCGADPHLPVVKRFVTDVGTTVFTGKGTIPGTDLKSSGSAKCDAYLWLKQRYLDAGKVNPSYAAYYIDAYWMKLPTVAPPNHHQLVNHDFFVGKRAWFFDLNVWPDEACVDDPKQKPGLDRQTLQALLKSAYDRGGKKDMIHIGGFAPWAHKYTTHGKAGGKHDPVPTEWEFIKLASAYNGFGDCDAIGLGAMANASFYQHYPLKPEYPQKWITHEQLKQRGYLTADGKVHFDGREFIVFYVGDYDAAAWLYQFMPTAWASPARGKVPLMWCISPVLARRAPMAMDYLRRTATPNDYFAAADNGAGYLNPGMLQEPRPYSGLPSGLGAWAAHCKPFYKQWGLTITGFIIDGFAPGLNAKGFACYASFSPNGIVPQKVPPALLHGDMPVLRADHDINHGPADAAKHIVARVNARKLPFHWFRNILKSPEWYVAVVDQLKKLNPKIELLDAPTFFELLRVYLKNHPEVARGQTP